MRLPRGYYRAFTALGMDIKMNVPGAARTARRYAVSLEQRPARLKLANERAVQWLSQRALDELVSRVEANGREQDPRRSLERVLRDPELTSTWSSDRFDFWVSKKVNRTAVRRYWRAIERGSNYWVEHSDEIRLFFRGPNAGPGGDNNRVPVAMRGVNARRTAIHGKGGGVIRRPIPAYHYLDVATTEFRQRGIWKRYVREAMKGT